MQVENVELIRAYGNMLKLVLTRGSLLQQLKSATAALQKAAEARTIVPAALERNCHSIKKKVAAVDEDIKVCFVGVGWVHSTWPCLYDTVWHDQRLNRCQLLGQHSCLAATNEPACALYLQAEQALGDTARVVGAFVTYRNESSRLNCLKATPQSWIKQWWHLKPQHKFRGRSVGVHSSWTPPLLDTHVHVHELLLQV